MSKRNSNNKGSLPSYMRDDRLMYDGGRHPEVPQQKRQQHKRAGSANDINCYDLTTESESTESIPPSTRRQRSRTMSDAADDIGRRRSYSSSGGRPSQMVARFAQQYNNSTNFGSMQSRAPRAITNNIPSGMGNNNMPSRQSSTTVSAGPRGAAPAVQYIGSSDSDDDINNNVQENAWSNPFVKALTGLMGLKHLPTNPDTWDRVTQGRDIYLKSLKSHRTALLTLARNVDKKEERNGESRYQVQLDHAIPIDTKQNISKGDLINIFKDTWRVLEIILCKNSNELSTRAMRDLQPYIGLMESLSNKAQAQVEREDNVHMNSKSDKLPSHIRAAEDQRGYLLDGATKPNRSRAKLAICPACGGDSMHEPPENKEIEKQHRIDTKKWKEVCAQIDAAREKKGQFPTNDKGNPIKTHPTAPSKATYLVCKQVSMVHSLDPNGFKCATCIDRSCDDCKNKCSFVCTHQNHATKKLFFDTVNADEMEVKQPAREGADHFLNNIARSRQTTESTLNASLKASRESGAIDSNTTDDEIHAYSSAVAFQSSSRAMLNNPPSKEGLHYMEEQIDLAQHEKGSTYTSHHGNTRKSSAKQRGANTRLTNAESLHMNEEEAASSGAASMSKACAASFAASTATKSIDRGGTSLKAPSAPMKQMTTNGGELLGGEEESFEMPEMSERDRQMQFLLAESFEHNREGIDWQPNSGMPMQHGSFGNGPFGTSSGYGLPQHGRGGTAVGRFGDMNYGGLQYGRNGGPGAAMLTPGLTPANNAAPTAKEEDETPLDIKEVREEADMRIMSPADGDDDEKLEHVQAVRTGLTRPRNEQLVDANKLLVKKNKEPKERLEKLVKIANMQKKSEE